MGTLKRVVIGAFAIIVFLGGVYWLFQQVKNILLSATTLENVMAGAGFLLESGILMLILAGVLGIILGSFTPPSR